MKKVIYILIFIMPLVGLAQNDSLALAKEQPTTDAYPYNNRLNLDVNLLGLGFTIHKTINDKFALTYGTRGGYILNYSPIFYERNYKSYKTNGGYVETISFNLGLSYSISEKWDFTGLGKIAKILSYYKTSPYGGISFQLFYHISKKSLIGTNIDIGIVEDDGNRFTSITTSFISYRIKIGK